MTVNHSKNPSRLRNCLGPQFFTTHSWYFLLQVGSYPTILWDKFWLSAGRDLQRPSVNTSLVLNGRDLGVTYRYKYILCWFSWTSFCPFIWSETSYRAMEEEFEDTQKAHEGQCEEKLLYLGGNGELLNFFAVDPLSETLKCLLNHE